MHPARLRSTPRTLAGLSRRLAMLLAVLAAAACSDDATSPAPTAPPAGPALARGAAGNSRPILFTSDRDTPDTAEIYALNPDGLGVTRLTFSPGHDADPAWSPDGKRIAFTRYMPDLASSAIYVMNANGTGVTRLTSSPGYDFGPSWSKDGKQIAFASTRAAQDPTTGELDSADVFVMNATGSGVTQLTFSPRQDAQPAWSPDGRQIAFVSARDLTTPENTGDVYVMNADGTQAKRLTTLEGAIVLRVSWSPDGRQLAFSAAPPNGGLDVYKLKPDGTQLTQLTFDGQSGLPSWSPDGNLIAFASGRDTGGSGEIYTMRADGTAATRLTVSPADDLSPAWFR